MFHALAISTLAMLWLLLGCEPSEEHEEDSPLQLMTIESWPLPSCDEPVPSPGAFADGLPESGIDFVHVAIPPIFDNTPQDDDPFNGAFGGGVVAADLDRDGATDLFFVQEDGANRLYWGRGDGSFEQAEDQAARTLDLTDSRSLYTNTADYDGDGLLDLLVTGYQSLHLFRNLGDRNFEDQADALRLEAPEGYPGGSAWGDYDQDGDLDLFVGSYGVVETGPNANLNGPDVGPSSLYRNDETVFIDRIADLPTVDGEEGACLQAAFRDLDDDGDLDLLQVNDFGPWRGMTNLWENGGRDGSDWIWTDRHGDSGIGNLQYPMGSLFRDLNDDQHPELWFSNIGATRLLRSTGEWEWVDVGAVWAGDILEEENDVSWSVVDIDLDGNGRAGVYINYGPHLGAEPPEDWGENYDPEQPDRFLVNDALDGDEPRFRLAPEVFPEPQIGNARGTAVADLDGNGVPDLVTSNLSGRPSVLMGQCTAARRVVVQLRDSTVANGFAIGAKVTIEAGALTQSQEISAGSHGSYSGEEPQLFFGLGDASQVDLLTVRWPDGTVEQADSLCSHCRILVERGR